MEAKEIILARDLVKVYKTEALRYKALDEVQLRVQTGEFVAIVGTSGSGKSTLLHLLAGLERPTMGKVIVMGQPVHAMTEEQLVTFRRDNIGVIFQSYNLMPALTALENVALPLTVRGIPKKQREVQAMEALERMGIAQFAAHFPKQLSGGQQQRVGIARALITKPKLLFADEPTGNLDSRSADDVMAQLLSTVREQQTTLLMVTHDITRARDADRIIHIADGRIAVEEAGFGTGEE